MGTALSDIHARVVCGAGRFGRGLARLLRSGLRWLDVPQRVLCGLGVTVPRCLRDGAPRCLVGCCRPASDVAGRRRLRSSGRRRLVVPRRRRGTLGRRALSVAGPVAWGALPGGLRGPSLGADSFRRKLETHLFRNALGHLAH